MGNGSDANEVLLFHGTPSATADSILREGFDDRFKDPKCLLYSHGLYFSTDPCKCIQYCGKGDADLATRL